MPSKSKQYFSYERRGEKVIPFSLFVGRLTLSFLVALSIILFGVALGLLGYHYIADLPWIDALLNASMILTGMGPVDPLKTNAAKLFASGYALFSGVVFLSSITLVLSPVIHRIIHNFHLIDEDTPESAPPGKMPPQH